MMSGYRGLERQDIMRAGMSIFTLMGHAKTQQVSKDLRTMQLLQTANSPTHYSGC